MSSKPTNAQAELIVAFGLPKAHLEQFQTCKQTAFVTDKLSDQEATIVAFYRDNDSAQEACWMGRIYGVYDLESHPARQFFRINDIDVPKPQAHMIATRAGHHENPDQAVGLFRTDLHRSAGGNRFRGKLIVLDQTLNNLIAQLVNPQNPASDESA